MSVLVTNEVVHVFNSFTCVLQFSCIDMARDISCLMWLVFPKMLEFYVFVVPISVTLMLIPYYSMMICVQKPKFRPKLECITFWIISSLQFYKCDQMIIWSEFSFYCSSFYLWGAIKEYTSVQISVANNLWWPSALGESSDFVHQCFPFYWCLPT